MLAELFPEAKFIHMVRDGRAVAASVQSLQWTHVPQTSDGLASWWESRVQHMTSWGLLNSKRVKHVRYEDLVAHPHLTLSEILRFLEHDDVEDTISKMLQKRPDGTVYYGRSSSHKIRKDHINAWRDREYEADRLKRAFKRRSGCQSALRHYDFLTVPEPESLQEDVPSPERDLSAMNSSDSEGENAADEATLAVDDPQDLGHDEAVVVADECSEDDGSVSDQDPDEDHITEAAIGGA